MKPITITSKRQATLPVDLCEELGVGPGDKLDLQRRTLDGQTVWILTARKPDWSWFGSLRSYGEGKSHDLANIDRSVERAMADGDDRS